MPTPHCIVDALAKEGAFKGGKLGIVAPAQDKALLEKVILPALKQDKISGTVAIANAPPGDIPAGQAEMDTILERFKSDGVKTILAEGGSIVIGRSASRPDELPTAPGGDE